MPSGLVLRLYHPGVTQVVVGPRLIILKVFTEEMCH
jgi:hypothetical protein